MQRQLTIYVDGSAHPNPGPGGFGVVVIDGDNIIPYSRQTDGPTTNNAEELKAILYTLLKYGTSKPTPVVYTDSAYALNTLTTWMWSWKDNGWLKRDNRIPENLDLIKTYYEYWQKGYRIDLRKVEGHSGNIYNDLADLLATGKLNAQNANEWYQKKRGNN